MIEIIMENRYRDGMHSKKGFGKTAGE